MLLNINDIMEYVEENDVKFIRLVFSDIFGNMKNISVMESELPRVLEKGVAFDASEIQGFMNMGESNLFLHPNTYTGEILPWRPQESRVIRFFCDIRYPDGTPFEGDSRHILRTAVEELRRLGLKCRIGAEPEFYLFQMDDHGQPTMKPHDRGSYFDVSPLDRGENIRREICLNLEQMGIRPQSSHHAQGPGQHEIVYRHGSALEAADHLLTFKNMVKTISDMNGLYAAFMPKPLLDNAGNGMHVNISLKKGDANLMLTEGGKPVFDSFIAGVLRRIKEMTALLNPTTNSYRRFGNFEAPKYITWSSQNRQQLIRIPVEEGENVRMELRSPDAACNPYIAYALLLYAGMEGIREELRLCEPVNILDKSGLHGLEELPHSLDEAIELAEHSAFLRKYLPQNILETFFAQKREECTAYAKASDKELFEYNRYFARV